MKARKLATTSIFVYYCSFSYYDNFLLSALLLFQPEEWNHKAIHKLFKKANVTQKYQKIWAV